MGDYEYQWQRRLLKKRGEKATKMWEKGIEEGL